MELLRDYLSSRVISQGKLLDNYSHIYFKSNENIRDFYPCFDFKDKDVLSVTASGDQAFMANYLGARKTDTFDKNVLAHYYLYLRKWVSKYNDELYPDRLQDNDYKWLASLLSKVKLSNDEEEKTAYRFWSMHLQNKTRFNKLFYDDPVEGVTIEKLDDILKKAIDKKVSFRWLDISSKEIAIKSGKYDIVLLSNIIDWARSNDKIILNTKNNLHRILKDDGIVLCSAIVNRSKESIDLERYIFSDGFSYQNYGRDKGYVYRKIK